MEKEKHPGKLMFAMAVTNVGTAGKAADDGKKMGCTADTTDSSSSQIGTGVKVVLLHTTAATVATRAAVAATGSIHLDHQSMITNRTSMITNRTMQ